MTIEELVASYQRIQDKLDVETEIFNKREKEFKRLLEEIKTEIIERAKQEGVEGFKTKVGSVSIGTDTQYYVQPSGWNDYYRFVHEECSKVPDPAEAMSRFFQKRVLQAGVKEYVEINKTLPPGMYSKSTMTATIRRK